MVVPTRPYHEKIGPCLLGGRSRANKQTSIGLYLLKLPLDGSLTLPAHQHLHSTRRQPFRIPVFAHRSHSFRLQLYKSILAVLSISRLLAECHPNLVATPKSTLDALSPSPRGPATKEHRIPAESTHLCLLINNNRKHGRHCRELVQDARQRWWAGG